MTSRHPRRFAAGLAALSTVALGASPASAHGLDGLVDALAQPWPALQQADGRFYDYVSGQADSHGRYGEAMLGVALMEAGLRTGNRARVDAGLRAVGYAVGRIDRLSAQPSVFENFALAAGYNTARARLAGDAHFEAVRPAWAAALRGIEPIYLRGRRTYWNKHIVEAAAVLELLRTGLRSTHEGAWLAERGHALRRAAGLVNRIVPGLTEDKRGETIGGRTLVLSDPPTNPIAYHALSLAFYARAVRLLGRDATAGARRTLAAAARASWTLTGPDGDLAYAGRSQDQSWTLAMTAYGATATGQVVSRRDAGRLHSLAARALSRLRSAYAVTGEGLGIVPALRHAPPAWYPGLDGYAGATVYNGLTLLMLVEMAELGVGRREDGGMASDLDGLGAVLRADHGDMAVARRGDVWFAVRRRRSAADLRYDFGIVAAKLRTAGGWTDVSPHRPKANGPSAGPTLLAAGWAYEPYGAKLAARAGAVTLTGGFGGASRKATFRYTAIDCGVRLAFEATEGDTYRYSAFFPSASQPAQTGPGTVAGQRQRVTVNAPVQVDFSHGFASAVEPNLVRADMTFAVDRTGTVTIDTCG
jgi:hypothetical protein